MAKRRTNSYRTEIEALSRQSEGMFGTHQTTNAPEPEPFVPAPAESRFFDTLALVFWSLIFATALSLLRYYELQETLVAWPLIAVLAASAIGVLRFLRLDLLYAWMVSQRMFGIRTGFLQAQIRALLVEDDDDQEEPEAEGMTEADINGAAWLILRRHYARGEGTTRSECVREIGCSQPVWNTVNSRLQEAGIKPSSRSFNDELNMAQAWALWTANQARYNATLTMATRRKR